MFENLSLRARNVVIETIREAQQRGADSIHLGDLVAELISEDQDPDSLDLNERDPHVKRFLERETKPPRGAVPAELRTTAPRVFLPASCC